MFSPHGKLPCLQHTNDNGKTLVVWDFLAIVEYLAEVDPSKAFWPGPANREARAFARCAASEMHCRYRFYYPLLRSPSFVKELSVQCHFGLRSPLMLLNGIFHGLA